MCEHVLFRCGFANIVVGVAKEEVECFGVICAFEFKIEEGSVGRSCYFDVVQLCKFVCVIMLLCKGVCGLGVWFGIVKELT